ncbi:unnamed protein product [Protopolystoma xenopodis]|uniref:Uncharacterized protein n=1 Tax=Protopolystoma xenopodis TaxID=117903 RepID=A0A3S5FGS7_9PLAT|nr:unnamed protein product [Protopolystoma xenopodis]
MNIRAANTVWPVGCIREHLLVDASSQMIQIAEFLLSKPEGYRANAFEPLFPGLYCRHYFPRGPDKYDLVISAYALIEQPDKSYRKKLISDLWEKTATFLVIMEQGTKAGFSAILEARDVLVSLLIFAIFNYAIIYLWN